MPDKLREVPPTAGLPLHWRDFLKLTIAQVQGYCIMGGLMLTTAYDLIVASERES